MSKLSELLGVSPTVITVYLLLTGVLCAIAVTDCTRRPIRNRTLWIVIICIGGIFGIIPYLLLGRNKLTSEDTGKRT